jgi:hypothetical protein
MSSLSAGLEPWTLRLSGDCSTSVLPLHDKCFYEIFQILVTSSLGTSLYQKLFSNDFEVKLTPLEASETNLFTLVIYKRHHGLIS